jgi:hypothetical protein
MGDDLLRLAYVFNAAIPESAGTCVFRTDTQCSTRPERVPVDQGQDPLAAPTCAAPPTELAAAGTATAASTRFAG